MKLLGMFFALWTYLVAVSFIGAVALKTVMLLRARPAPRAGFSRKPTLRSRLLAIGDIIFLRRLLVVDDLLWIGEWVFHFSLIFLFIRHLRYILEPIPDWVWFMQKAGIIAGYIMPVALVYILIMKLVIEKKKYISSYNFFLLGLLLLMGGSGVIMTTFSHPDVVAVKEFLLGTLSFRPGPMPPYPLFIFHYAAFLVLAFYLPTHIIAAPFTILEQRRREEELKGVIHERER